MKESIIGIINITVSHDINHRRGRLVTVPRYKSTMTSNLCVFKGPKTFWFAPKGYWGPLDLSNE